MSSQVGSHLSGRRVWTLVSLLDFWILKILKLTLSCILSLSFMCLSTPVAFNFFQFWTPKIFFCGSVDLCIPYSSLLTKAFCFLITLCRSLRNFARAARLKPHRSAVRPTSIGLSFSLSPLHMHTLTYSIYSWQMQSSSLAKGIQKKSLCHNYPFQLLLTFSLKRFPAKDYWGLVLVRKRKKKCSFLIKRKSKLETVKRQSFQGSLSTRRLDIAQNQ